MKALLLIFIMLGAANQCARIETPQRLPLIHADYPVCVTVKPGTLEPKRGVNLYPRQKDVA